MVERKHRAVGAALTGTLFWGAIVIAVYAFLWTVSVWAAAAWVVVAFLDTRYKLISSVVADYIQPVVNRAWGMSVDGDDGQ